MRLHWVFTVQTVVILPKNTFAFMFNRPRSTYTGRAGGSARGKGFNNTFFTRSSVCSMWPDGNDMGRRIDGPEFACFLFFLSFSFGLVFFLVITVFFLFLYTADQNFQIYKFSSLLPYLAVLPKSFVRSCDLRISSYWDTQREPLRSTEIYYFFGVRRIRKKH